MKTMLTNLLLTGFLGISVFGFVGMHHDLTVSHSGCFANLVTGMECPYAPGTLPFIDFHLNALKFFSSAVFGSGISLNSVLFFVALLLLMVYIAAIVRDALRLVLQLVETRLKLASQFFITFQGRQLMRWLALHERRDPATLSF